MYNFCKLIKEINTKWIEKKNMKTYDSNIPLISIHIPKCAGASFRRILKYWYKKNLYTHYYNEKLNIPPKKHNYAIKKRGIFRKNITNNICIHGHFNWKRGYGVNDYYPNINQYVTMLRDPFEIHVSNYFYIKRLGENAYYNGELNEIIKNDYNFYTYTEKRSRSYLLHFFPPEITLSNFKDIIKKYYIYIGIVEDMKTSIDILAQKLDFSPPPKIQLINASLRSENISDDWRNSFIKNNQFEMTLYKYILDIYDK